jgi:diadenosine tetraphosphatase ApaH/serine/threonine PP2A family protein phosphatase
MDWLDAIGQLEFLDNTPVRACFFGHSHLAGLFAEKGTRPSAGSMTHYTLAAQNRYLINPGSVGQPRDGDPRAAFGLLDVQTMTFEFHRVEYDTVLAARKIVDAGLPVILARRLDRGK